MKIFKSTEEKFDTEKKYQMAALLIRAYRDAKIKFPETKYSKLILEMCEKLDPEHKLSERELVEELFKSQEVKDTITSSIDEDSIFPDEVICNYIDAYYEVLIDLMSSTNPSVYDVYEYQTQQLISILSPKKINMVSAYLKEKMDRDKSCPYFIKKNFSSWFRFPKTFPTWDDENLAEKIINLVSPGLRKSNKEVFRALVDSLKWRGTEELKRTLISVEKSPPNKRHLRGRESCLFIETDKKVHYIG